MERIILEGTPDQIELAKKTIASTEGMPVIREDFITSYLWSIHDANKYDCEKSVVRRIIENVLRNDSIVSEIHLAIEHEALNMGIKEKEVAAS